MGRRTRPCTNLENDWLDTRGSAEIVSSILHLSHHCQNRQDEEAPIWWASAHADVVATVVGLYPPFSLFSFSAHSSIHGRTCKIRRRSETQGEGVKTREGKTTTRKGTGRIDKVRRTFHGLFRIRGRRVSVPSRLQKQTVSIFFCDHSDAIMHLLKIQELRIVPPVLNLFDILYSDLIIHLVWSSGLEHRTRSNRERIIIRKKGVVSQPLSGWHVTCWARPSACEKSSLPCGTKNEEEKPAKMEDTFYPHENTSIVGFESNHHRCLMSGGSWTLDIGQGHGLKPKI